MWRQAGGIGEEKRAQNLGGAEGWVTPLGPNRRRKGGVGCRGVVAEAEHGVKGMPF